MGLVIGQLIRHFLLFSISLVFFFLAASPGQAQPAGNWDILVLPLYHEQTLDAGHPAYRRIDQDIRQQLTDSGYRVFNAESIGLDIDCTARDCSPENAGELIQEIRELNRTRVRRSETPVDMLWYFEITHRTKSGPAVDKFVFSVFSQLVDLDQGIDIANTRDLPQERPYSARDRGDTRAAWEAEQVYNYGRGATYDLIQKFGSYVRQTDFAIKLIDYTVAELKDIQYFIESDPEYRAGSLETVGSMLSRNELLHNRATQSFRFRTEMDRTQVNSILLRAIEAAGAGDPVASGKDNAMIFARASMPFLAWYLSGLALLVIVLAAVVIAANYRRHDRNLTYIYNNANASQGVEYLKSAMGPHPKKWDTWAEEWNVNITEAEKLVVSADLAVRENDYEKAKDDVARALQLNSDNSDAQTLRGQLPDWEKGYRLFKIAESELREEPSRAAKRLDEAGDLNPHIKKRIDELKIQAEQLLRQGALADNMNKARQHMESGKPYQAITAVDTALNSIDELAGFAVELDQLNAIREEALRLIPALPGSVVGLGELAATTLLTADAVEIGRQSGSNPGDVMLGFKRLSRAGKQTRIVRTGNGYAVQDQGSSNGTVVDGRVLESGESAPVGDSLKLAMGGSRDGGSLGNCQLLLTPAKQSRKSLVMRIDQSSLALLDRAALAEAWPGLDEDAAHTWALVGESIAVGVNAGKLDVGCLQADSPLLFLTYDEAWKITPAQLGPDSGITIDGCVLFETVPVAPRARIEVAGHWFSLAGE